MKKIIMFVFFCLGILASEFNGSWVGELKGGGTKLPVVFRIDNDRGELDSPKQNVFKIGTTVRYGENQKMTIEIKSFGAFFEGELINEEIKGTFNQMGQKIDLVLKKGEYTGQVKGFGRPQEPKEPFDYNESEVAFESAESGIDLRGTLTTPKNIEEFPVVILVSGSGPNNRNEEIMGHKPFLVLSDYLTKNGIGVFRYDDRGVGKSGGDFKTATTENFAMDLIGAIEKMKKLGYKKIGVLGHSEGGLIIDIASEKGTNVNFIIQMAGPSQRGKEVLITQIGKILDTMKMDSLAKDRAMKETERALEVIVENPPNIQDELEKVYAQGAVGMTDEEREIHIKQSMAQVANPWYYYFVRYNPYNALKNLKIKTLALFGTKDIQVDAKENMKILKEIDNENIDVVLIKGVNHLFQKAKTGSISEYQEIEETINEKVLITILEWIKKVNV